MKRKKRNAVTDFEKEVNAVWDAQDADILTVIAGLLIILSNRGDKTAELILKRATELADATPGITRRILLAWIDPERGYNRRSK